MDEPTTIFHRFFTLVIGILVIFILALVGAKGFSSASASGAMADASNNPNVVTGVMGAAFTVMGDAADNTGHSLYAGLHTAGNGVHQASRVALTTTVNSGKFVGNSVMTTGRFVGSSAMTTGRFIGSSVYFSGRLFGTVSSQEAHVEGVAIGASARFVGSTIGDGVALAGHNLVGSMVLTANTASSTTAFIADAAIMANITQPADKTSTPTIKPMEVTSVALGLLSKYAPAPVAAAPAPAPTPAPVPKAPVQYVTAADIGSDLYAWGNCTWWAAHRRIQINDPIPNSWGNATSWAYYARQDGYAVDHTPSPGAIMQISGVYYGLGHVAFVESVDSDGTWHISEMNVLGLNVVDDKAEPPSAAANYFFIHDKQ